MMRSGGGWSSVFTYPYQIQKAEQQSLLIS